MDDITAAIAGATFRMQDRRIILWAERESGMSRLTEKLALAGGVVARATAAIEAEADAVIAREAEIKTRTKEAFSGHHAMLEEARRGLDALEHQLATVTNDPLQSSGGLSEEPPEPTPLPAKPTPIAIPTEPPQPLHDGIDRFVREQASSRIVGVVAVPARRWLR